MPAYLRDTPQGVVAAGDVAAVRALLAKPPLPVDGQGRTLLHIAAIHGRLEIVRLLLEHGEKASALDANGATPLHAAAYGIHWMVSGMDHGMRLLRGCGNEQEAVARLLLERGVDPLALDERQRTPLHDAAKGGNPDVARLLLDRKADPRAADEDGRTPLHEAAAGGCHEPGLTQFTIAGDHAEVARLLLAQGAAVDAPSSLSGTPLGVAIRSGAPDLARILLGAGANPAADVGGWSIPPLLGAAYDGHLELVVAFLDKGAPIETRDGRGRTPLYMGALAGREDVVRMLRGRGAKLDMADHGGETALHAAAHSGHVPTLALLVNQGGDVRAKSSDGSTLLHAAAGGCHAGGVMLDYLLEKGLDIDARDKEGRTPLTVAEKSDCLIGGSPMTASLLRRGARR